jgi:hypothetical protein
MKYRGGTAALCVTLREAKDEYQRVANGHHADHRMAKRFEEPGAVDWVPVFGGTSAPLQDHRAGDAQGQRRDRGL